MEFWRTEHWLEYLLHSRLDKLFVNRSFYQNNILIPLIQDGCELYSPGFNDDKEILQQVKEIALKNGIKRIQVDSQIKSYLNISGFTCIIDPTDPADFLNMTKGHRSAIKKAEKYLEWEPIEKLGGVIEFMHDYFVIAGKQTRPHCTFWMLYWWIQIGYGTLLKATYQGQTAGYIYILHYQSYAYYFMSCVAPEFKRYNVSHYLQSIAFKILAGIGINQYELGDQPYNGLTGQPSQKDRDIASFKRHFGGQIVIKPKSEYFFDPDYFRETMNSRVENYIRSEFKL